MSRVHRHSHSRAHSPTFPSQLIPQPFRCFTYVTAHSPTLLSLLLRYRLFAYVTWRAAHGPFMIQRFRHLTYVTAHSPTLPSLYLRHSSFSNPSVASPTSQLVLQPFFHFSYVTVSSLTSPDEPPMERALSQETLLLLTLWSIISYF